MVGVAVAFAIALTWSILSIWVGPRIGLVDVPTPDPLKVHKRPTPLLGGIGIFAGFHIGMFIENAVEPGLVAATAIILTLGVVDDRFGLSAKLRLGVEVAAAVVLVLTTDIGAGSVVMSVLAVVGIVVAINAVNLFDGLDGLVGSVTLVGAIALALAGASGFGGSALGLALAGATAGFLVVNWHPARIFLGDNGAYLVGMVLAYGVLAAGNGDIVTTMVLSVGVLGIYVLDLVTTIARRLSQGTSIFEGDRSHLYDQLRDRRVGIRAVALIAAGSQALLAAATLALLRIA